MSSYKSFRYLTDEDEDSIAKNYTLDEIESLFIARQDCNAGQIFYVYGDVNDWLDSRDEAPEAERCFHEIVFSHVMQKIRLDLDVEHNDYELLLRQVQYIEHKMCDVFRQLYYEKTGWDFSEDDILQTISRNHSKLGVHLCVPYYLARNTREVKLFVRELEQAIKMDGADDNEPNILRGVEIDKGVYGIPTTNFRLIGSFKGDRVKELTQESIDRGFDEEDAIITYIKTEYKKLPSLVPKKGTTHVEEIPVIDEHVAEIVKVLGDKMTGFSVRGFSHKGHQLDFNRHSPSYCNICDREHEHDNSLVVLIESDGSFYQMCRRNQYRIKIPLGQLSLMEKNTEDKDLTKDGKIVFNEDSDVVRGRMSEVVKKINATKRQELKIVNHQVQANLPYLLKNSSFQGQQIIRNVVDPTKGVSRIKNEMDMLTKYCETDKYDAQSVRPYKKCNTLFVRAQMKMGKTRELRRFITENYKPTDVIVIVSFRRAFSNSIKEDFKEFELYNTIGGVSINLNTWPRLIIQAESLHRIDISDLPPIALVVMDESESVIGQFNSGNFNYLDSAFGAFQTLLAQTTQLVCIDANLGQRTFRVVRMLRHGKITLNWNTYEINRGSTFYFTGEIGDWLGSLKDLLEKKKRIAIPTNSIKTAQGLERWIHSKFPKLKILCYSSKTLESIKRKHFANVNKYWKECDVLIYTPTISAGVSFTEKHFHYIFGAFIDMSCDVETCHQMIGRVRDVADKKYYIYLNGRGDYLPTDVRVIEQAIVYEREMVMHAQQSLHFELDEGLLPNYFKSKYYRVWLENTRIRNLSRNRFIERFIAQAIASGRQIKLLHRDQRNDNIICKEEFSLSKKQIEFEEHKLISNSPNITSEEFHQLQSKIDLMMDVFPEDRAKIDRHILNLTYNWRDKKMDPEWVKTYIEPRTKAQYRNLQDILQSPTVDDAIEKMVIEERTKRALFMAHQQEAKDINFRYKSQRHKIVLDIIELLGFSRNFTEQKETKKSKALQRIQKNLAKLQKSVGTWTILFGVRYVRNSKDNGVNKMFELLQTIIYEFYGIRFDEIEGIDKLTLVLPEIFAYNKGDPKIDRKPLILAKKKNEQEEINTPF